MLVIHFPCRVVHGGNVLRLHFVVSFDVVFDTDF